MSDIIDGSHIVGTLLRDFGDLATAVAAENIKEGALPANAGLPALLVTSTSWSARATLKRGGVTRTVERISVTVRAASHRDRKRVLGLVNQCLAGRTGDIGGGTRVAIRAAGRGPDLRGPGDSFERTADYRVSYDA